MNKYQYLNILDSRLKNALPKEEYHNVMQYYNEYFADAGMDREGEVIEELGDPENLAKKIILESTGIPPKDEVSEKKHLSWPFIILIAIVGSPLWLTLFCVGITVIAVAASLIFSFGIVTAVMAFVSVVLFVGGITYLFTDIASALVVIGTGLLCGAVGICMLMACRGLARLFVRMMNRKGRRAL